MKKIPTEQQCFEILKEYGTPEHVIAHCTGVCSVAVALGEQLNRVGYSIDIPLLRASAASIAAVRPLVSIMPNASCAIIVNPPFICICIVYVIEPSRGGERW